MNFIVIMHDIQTAFAILLKSKTECQKAIEENEILLKTFVIISTIQE